jgi:hypothetical protein
MYSHALITGVLPSSLSHTVEEYREVRDAILVPWAKITSVCYKERDESRIILMYRL